MRALIALATYHSCSMSTNRPPNIYVDAKNSTIKVSNTEKRRRRGGFSNSIYHVAILYARVCACSGLTNTRNLHKCVFAPQLDTRSKMITRREGRLPALWRHSRPLTKAKCARLSTMDHYIQSRTPL